VVRLRHLHGRRLCLRRACRRHVLRLLVPLLRWAGPAVLRIRSRHRLVHGAEHAVCERNLCQMRRTGRLVLCRDLRRCVQRTGRDLQQQQPLRAVRLAWDTLLSRQSVREPRLLLQQHVRRRRHRVRHRRRHLPSRPLLGLRRRQPGLLSDHDVLRRASVQERDVHDLRRHRPALLYGQQRRRPVRERPCLHKQRRRRSVRQVRQRG